MSETSKFKQVETKIAKRLEGEEVPEKWQHKYGKTYSKAEAEEAAGAITAEAGRRKLGHKKMVALAIAGRRRKARTRKRGRARKERYM